MKKESMFLRGNRTVIVDVEKFLQYFSEATIKQKCLLLHNWKLGW